ncbi:MAG: carbohydrate ABC transporter permease [Christensenellales bacterium]|jgi:sn-glycerol 3-phosphate transport system permease protein
MNAAPARRTKQLRQHIISYLMIMPAIAFLSVFVIYPMLHLIQLSLYTGNANNPYKKFVLFENFRQILFVKPDFMIAVRNTAVYTVSMVVLLIFFAVIFALWMYKDRAINRVAQTVFFTPHLVATISCAFIWSWLYNSNSYGLFNSVLALFGINPIRWLDTTDTAMLSVIIMNIWKGIGYYALIVMSALKAIPVEIYEAAKLDNASPLKVFFKITLPMLSPQLFFMLITITTGSFKVFDSIRIMTNGGPGRSTQVMTMYIYDYAFQRNNTLGIGAAAGVVLMLILFLITVLDFKGFERRVHYQ